MEQKNLVEDMIQIASDLTKRDDITEDTKVSDVITDSGVNDGNNVAVDFKAGVEFTIEKNGGTNKEWPSGWADSTFGELAGKLLLILILIFGLFFTSQAQLVVNIGTGKTDLKKSAIEFSISYIKSLDSLIGGKEVTKFGKHSVFQFTPQFDIQSGSADALNSINMKLTGLLLNFKTKKMPNGDLIPNFAVPFTSFPFSAGIETNNTFSFLNTIVEAGFVPVFIGRDNAEVLRHMKLGVYLQAGYKFKLDTAALVATGGDKDESHESLNSNILRAKGSISVDSKTLATVGYLRFGLAGSADVWYDFMNGALYHKIDAAMRIYLVNNDYIELVYQHGSGAPLFNTGSQFIAGLSITF